MQDGLLTILRDEKTPVDQFRQTARQLADLLAAEVKVFIAVKTFYGQAEEVETLQRGVLVPTLRAVLAMLPSFLKFFLQASVGFFGIRRDEATAKTQFYYENLPALKPTDLVFILDPMIATAGEDSELSSKKFIVSGLGDFGDRYFEN